MKRLVILGATGSIGTTCLSAIRRFSLPVEIVGISANSNYCKLEQIAKEFSVHHVALTRHRSTIDVENVSLPKIPENTDELTWYDNIPALLDTVECDIVLNAVAGFDGLQATLACLERHLDIALANKESVVTGGNFIFEMAQRSACSIIPVDSEHSAIYHLIAAHDRKSVDSLLVTASGGPFRTWEASLFSSITPEQALQHPTWKMGKKITIDSATLANKALEVIEASYLFGFPPEKIKVVVHPQSIVHSMVRMKDGAVYAQMATPDMSLPIIEAILGRQMQELVSPLSFTDLDLHFEQPDTARFPLLKAAYEVIRLQGGYPTAFNGANEEAVNAFLNHRISFTDISTLTLKVLEQDFSSPVHCYADVLEADVLARKTCKALIRQIS
ncbi:MAG: 1-deoxy-D-xylulose-5-phosphate reductoisomerase [Spirochaetia bacterium]|jgi:1-deoxy-D-xylulose-5-phosphate reductoisomerase|nr:1-deoxy-D-xylulose-5-phosphate reductoisomerase [Spirochaetia bacterium]